MKTKILILALTLIVAIAANIPFNTTPAKAAAINFKRNFNVTFAPGKVGDAAIFDGVSWLSAADNASLSTGDVSFSIAGWTFASVYSGNQIVVSKWDGTSQNNEYRVYFEDGLLKFDVGNGDSATIDLSEEDVDAGEWLFFIAKYDASTDTASLEVNNSGNVASVGSVAAPPDGTAAFGIGALGDDGDQALTGGADAVYFYKKALSSTEEDSLWNSGNGLEI